MPATTLLMRSSLSLTAMSFPKVSSSPLRVAGTPLDSLSLPLPLELSLFLLALPVPLPIFALAA
jgi:hypothetical protein